MLCTVPLDEFSRLQMVQLYKLVCCRIFASSRSLAIAFLEQYTNFIIVEPKLPRFAGRVCGCLDHALGQKSLIKVVKPNT